MRRIIDLVENARETIKIVARVNSYRDESGMASGLPTAIILEVPAEDRGNLKELIPHQILKITGCAPERFSRRILHSQKPTADEPN